MTARRPLEPLLAALLPPVAALPHRRGLACVCLGFLALNCPHECLVTPQSWMQGRLTPSFRLCVINSALALDACQSSSTRFISTAALRLPTGTALEARLSALSPFSVSRRWQRR